MLFHRLVECSFTNGTVKNGIPTLTDRRKKEFFAKKKKKKRNERSEKTPKLVIVSVTCARQVIAAKS